MLDPSLSLKITPPHVHAASLPRAWLVRLFDRMRDRRVVVVRAPAGYGKTALLAQWRREVLSERAFAGWLALDERDDRARFVHGFGACLRASMGNPHFGTAALEAAHGPEGETVAITALLAGIAEAARPTVAFLDDAHLLPKDAAQALLPYLLHNLPPNMQLVIATRQGLGLPQSELAARGEFVEIGVEELRLRVEESSDFLRARFGERFDADVRARIHEYADGWPIALMMIASVLERDATMDPSEIVGKSPNIEHFFTETLIAQLPPAHADLLVTASILDALHPELLEAMTGRDDIAALLELLAATTPILSAGEGSAWLRMHPLARDSFGRHFSALSTERQRELHWRAAKWLHERGDAEAAARHALAADRQDIAYEWIGYQLHELAMTSRRGEVLRWAEQLPPHVAALPEVCLGIGWAQTLTYQTRAAVKTLAPLATATDPQVRYEAALIESSIAIFEDDYVRMDALLKHGGDAPAGASARLKQIHANVLAYVLVERGESARARYLRESAVSVSGQATAGLASHSGELVIGLSHLRNAQPLLADASLRPALARAEAATGRRGSAACNLAAVHGAALWAQDRRHEAELVLAYRLDIVERASPPEVVAMMYVTLARLAFAAGSEPHGLELLARLEVIGEERRLPRLVLHSLREQIRLHATAHRSATACELGERLEACWLRLNRVAGPGPIAYFDLIRRMGIAYLQIAAHDTDGARKTLDAATKLAVKLNHQRDLLEARVLQAVAADRGDCAADEALREILSIAESNGIARLFADTHPAAIERVRTLGDGAKPGVLGGHAWSHAFAANVTGEGGTRNAAVQPPTSAVTAAAHSSKGTRPALFTSKEALTLTCLAQGMSNKAIARTLDLSPETVKWHLKSVFAKLNAGSRQHAVDRARMLGLL